MYVHPVLGVKLWEEIGKPKLRESQSISLSVVTTDQIYWSIGLGFNWDGGLGI